MTILIVHQSLAICKILRRAVEIVRIPGLDFLESANGLKALEVLQRVDQLDCIFIEVYTSKMHSADFIHSVTNLPENKRWASIPIFVVDAEGNCTSEVITAIGRGASGFIQNELTSVKIKELLEGAGLIKHEN